MNASVISKEKNAVKFSFKVSADKFEEGMKYSYKKNVGKFPVDGFRKGKVPRKIIERSYGESVFYDDALNFVLDSEYDNAVNELELEVVSKPSIDVKEIDKENGVSFEAEVTVKPEVVLGEYKGLTVEKVEVEVKDEEIEKELSRAQEQNSRTITITDRPAKTGDIVNISYEGTIDGVPFDGGKSESHELLLGSGSFIDTFEDQTVGHVAGDAFDVTVTFPNEYHEKTLAGKEAVFAVTVKEISVKELPELNDEFAQDVSEFETFDEYKASIADKIKKAKEERAKQEESEKMMEIAVANAQMDVPEVMIDNKVDAMLQDFASNMTGQGISLELYLKYMGTTEDELKKSFRTSAEKNVKSRLVLEAVAKAEAVEVTEEEVKEEIINIGKGYGIEEEQILKLIAGEDKKSIEKGLGVQKALKLMEDSMVLVEPVKKDEPEVETKSE